MIPRDYITQWRAQAPQNEDFQVEQDLVISRALVNGWPLLAEVSPAVRASLAAPRKHSTPGMIEIRREGRISRTGNNRVPDLVLG